MPLRDLAKAGIFGLAAIHPSGHYAYPWLLQVKLELKVGRNNSREKGIVEESKKLKASTLVLGTNARGMFSM